jgi:PPM family protein phosphatase
MAPQRSPRAPDAGAIGSLTPPSRDDGRGERTTRVTFGGLTHAGKVRAVNQDSYWVGDIPGKGTLAVVADGMGGHKTGEVASRQAVETFRVALERSAAHAPAAIARSAQAANLEIYAYAVANQEHRGMGTTLTSVLVDDQVAIVGHVGDSRAYLVRDGAIEQLTHDHSWVADRVRQGLLTSDEARRHRWRNVITNALGATATFKLDLHHFEVRDGDRILVCSDGVSILLSDAMMADIVSEHPPQEAAERLVAEANDRGSPDNVTAVVLHVHTVGPRPKRYTLPDHDGTPSSIEISDTLSGIRKVEDTFPVQSLLNAMRRQAWYPYRIWVIGSLYLVLLVLVFAIWRGGG